MNTTALTLILAGSFVLALFAVLSKYYQRGNWANRSALVAATASGGAACMLIAYSLALGGPYLQEGWVLPVILTGILNIGIIYARTRARAIEDVSLVTPIDSTTPAIVIFTAIVINGEYPPFLGWLGIWVMVIGTYVLNIQELREKLLKSQELAALSWWRKQLRIWLTPFLVFRKSAGVRWALFAALLASISLNYDGQAARRADVGFGFGLIYAIVAVGNLAIALILGECRKVDWKGLALRWGVLGLPMALGTALVALSFRYSLVAYVGTVRRITIPMAIVLAFLILGERKSFSQRIVGGIIMAIGAALITLAK